jgi:hypothetical protein
MAFSIHDVIHHSQSSRYPNVIKKWNDIAHVTPETMDDGTEVFRFLRPSVSGAVNAENLPIGEISAVSKDALNEYAKKNFGGELPEVIAAHGFSEAGMQLDSPNQILDPRYSSVRANGINQNHGWKIHADFVSDLTKDEAYARAGRASDLSIIDQNTADIFDKRLANLGVDSNKFLNFYGKNHLKATGASFIDPNDIISASEVFQESGLTYKIAPDKYGSGRHLSAYPQSLEARDEITTKLEKKLGNRLVDQNDPNYRFNLPSDRDTGVKNTPISRGVSARFTTDYLGQDVATGKFDLASQFDESTLNDKGIVAPDKKFIVTGEINPEQIQRINSLTAESPEMARLLHGEDGYVSPYKTIEQIAQERSSGKIPISDSPKAIGMLKDAVPIDDYNYKGPLPAISRPGSVATGAAATMPSSGPSLDAIKAAMGDSLPSNTEPDVPNNLTPQQQAFLDDIKAEKAADEAFAVESLGKTKKAVEESGYLYHYAPRDVRDSIFSEGLQTSKARTAVQDSKGPLAKFSTHVPENSMYFFTNPNDAPSAGIIFGYDGAREMPDLYRVKVTPEILEGMVVDPRLAIRDGVASAVIVPSKTGSFEAELIGENAKFASIAKDADPEIAASRVSYDPVNPKVEAKIISENVVSKPTGEPVSPASESVDKAKTARKGPSDLGTPADIKTKPTVEGTKRPIVDIPTPPPTGTSTSPNNATAAVTTNAPQVSPNPAPPSSGSPPKGKSLMDDAFNTARNVAKGTGNARNLGIIGAATLLGAGAFTMRKKSEEDMQRRMDLQRYGEIK